MKMISKSIKHNYANRGKHHVLYDRWVNIKSRCFNKNHRFYNRYGGRGITMFAGWLNNPAKFIEYCLSIGYDEKLTIDRIRNDGNYEPGNIRFVTTKVNNRNGRCHLKMNMARALVVRKLLLLDCFTQRRLARIYGVSQRTIFDINANTKWV